MSTLLLLPRHLSLFYVLLVMAKINKQGSIRKSDLISFPSRSFQFDSSSDSVLRHTSDLLDIESTLDVQYFMIKDSATFDYWSAAESAHW